MTPPAVLRLLQRFNGAARAEQARAPDDRADALEPQVNWAIQPWRRSPFIWQQRALSGARIGAFLLQHGFRPMTPAGTALLDAAIADPVAAIEDPAPLWAALFGRQLVECSLDAGAGQPRADRLLSDLSAAARPSVALTEVRQVLYRGRTLVMFRYLGQRHAFSVSRLGSRLDVDAVLSGFNALMTYLAHPCRGFRIDRPWPPEGSANAAAYLIVTRADRFEAAARALAIPLAAQPVRRTT
jgi:hypothetical protein